MPRNPRSPPGSLPPPRGADRVCSGALPSSYVLRARTLIWGGDAESDCHYLSVSPPQLPLSHPPPPLYASDLDGPLSVWHLSLYCQASGGSHLKITLPGHTQASLNACQFTHGKRITRLLLGSRKLLLMAMQIIRVHLALPANRFFMRDHS